RGPEARLRQHRQDAEDAAREDAGRGGRRLLPVVPRGARSRLALAARRVRPEDVAVVGLDLDPVVAPLLAALAVLLFAGLAEALHARRVRRVAVLAFGPGGKPAAWAQAAPYLRVLALAALAWGLATLLLVEPKRYALGKETTRREGDYRHVLL